MSGTYRRQPPGMNEKDTTPGWLDGKAASLHGAIRGFESLTGYHFSTGYAGTRLRATGEVGISSGL